MWLRSSIGAPFESKCDRLGEELLYAAKIGAIRVFSRPCNIHPTAENADNPGVQIIHRGKYKSLSGHEKRLLKRRWAIEPLIGHTKADHRMDRCWLQGALGDALHALSCAAGYNIRWLLRAIVRLGLRGLLCALSTVIAYAARCLRPMQARAKANAFKAPRRARATGASSFGAVG